MPIERGYYSSVYQDNRKRAIVKVLVLDHQKHPQNMVQFQPVNVLMCWLVHTVDADATMPKLWLLCTYVHVYVNDLCIPDLCTVREVVVNSTSAFIVLPSDNSICSNHLNSRVTAAEPKCHVVTRINTPTELDEHPVLHPVHSPGDLQLVTQRLTVVVGGRRCKYIFSSLLYVATQNKTTILTWHHMTSCDTVMWRHVILTHIKKVSWNVKSGKEDIKPPAPDSETLQVSNGKACSTSYAVIQTCSQLFVWVWTTKYKSTIATKWRGEQVSTLTGSCLNPIVHSQSTHQFTAGTSPCAYIRQPYDESIRGLPLKHVYKHFWGIAIVVEILNNKCTVSFRIQCPRYSMIQIGQASYFATLSCRKKYMEHWWGTVIILFRATYVAIL